MIVNFFTNEFYLNASIILGFFGLIGIILNRYNLIIIIICIEIMFFGMNYFLATSAVSINDIKGLSTSLFILTVAATESAIALGLLCLYYKIFNTIILSFN